MDERFEDEPFSQTEKIDICTQVSELADNSDVLDGKPHLDIVEEPDWFCRIDNIEWTKLDAGATIELGFREYTDEEIQNIQDQAAKNGTTSTCGLITFYEGDLVLTDSARTPASCGLQTTVHRTGYLVRNSTAITLKLKLDGSPEEHTTYDLHEDDSTVYMGVMELLDRY
ncbi:hypothetical protein ACFQ3B_09475 [Stackebrandtia endophytica]|uniref:hypothetical protein n=1 Tax=Stackebrandtia endophytica TaxID=1496996 RepID=UPI001152322B|nr:hypothetical protein [Stackebrandtia endophytica]